MLQRQAGRIQKKQKQDLDARDRITKLGGHLLKQAIEKHTIDDICDAFAKMKGPDAQHRHDEVDMIQWMESCPISNGESKRQSKELTVP